MYGFLTGPDQSATQHAERATGIRIGGQTHRFR